MKILARRTVRRWSTRAAQTVILVAVVGWLGIKLVPIPEALLHPPLASVEFTDRHGAPLREARTDDRFTRPVGLEDVPSHLVHAILAAEDKRFFEHRGVDWLATARASWDAVRYRRFASGASTITQQLVKCAHPRPRTVRTKLIEAVTALRLEQLWDKDRILEEYVNRVDFGHLNVGITAAASYYFGKPLTDLSDAESAFLAGLPKNPTRLNPHRSPGAAQARQQTVLRRMRENRWLTADEYLRATRETLHLQPPHRVFRAPHFIDLVLRNLENNAAGSHRTTLDLPLNQRVEQFVREQIAKLDDRNAHSGAAVVIANATGDVLALIGSEDYFAPGTGQVNGAWAPRSPGSTIKPFTYLLALEKGATPATVVADVPSVFGTPTGAFHPENYNRQCTGPVRYRLALANSLNIPAVKVLASIGGPSVLQKRLTELGLTTLTKSAVEYGLGMTIGNAEARLLELTNAYASLARLGESKPFRLLATPRTTADSLWLCDPRAAWLVADILNDNAARTPSFGAHSALRFDFPVACKTGTSTDYRDNWAIGYTPEFTVGVWVGNFDGSAMRGISGVSGAAPILHDIFDHLHDRFGTSWYPTPAGIVERDVHPITGKVLTAPRSDAVREKFLTEHLPPTESRADYDEQGRVILSAEYAAWSASAENHLTDRTTVPENIPLRVLAPVPGTTFIIDPDLPTSRRAQLVATGPATTEWKSDSLQCTGTGREAMAVLTEGEHRLSVVDPATGAHAETWIRVKSL
jgi:penicillin-binding protein 1C